MTRHHVEVSQLTIEVGERNHAPYMNVIAKDYVTLGVITHSDMQLTFLYRSREGFIGLFAFPNQEAFNEYSATRPGHWQEVVGLTK